MEINKSGDFRGFTEDDVWQTSCLSVLYKNTLERYEYNLNQFEKASLNMNPSLRKCYEDNCASLRGIVTDNDSGYISQNVESNSSADTSLDHRQVLTILPQTEVKEIFINEDALLEKPVIFSKNDELEDNEYREFDHLYFMSGITDTSIVPSSVVSQETTFSGFEADSSEVLDLSGTLPLAPSIIVSPKMLEPKENFNIKTLILDSEKENDCNYENIKNNLKFDMEENKLNSSFEETDACLNSIQSRMMSANNDMSLFESFYSFVCKLYTKNETIIEDLSTNSINPSQLHINQIQKEVSSPCKNSYVQLKSVIMQEVTTTTSSTPCKEKDLTTVPVSPELFSDDEVNEPTIKNNSLLQKSNDHFVTMYDDYTLLKRTRNSLGGVPPPPSITISLLTLPEILDKVATNNHLFVTKDDVDNFKKTNQDETKRSLLINSNETEYKTDKWPEVLQLRFHGLYYNKSKTSEEFEHLCVKYAERYIGAETQSSCTVFGVGTASPTKRKCKYRRTVKSPGKRLSHLARRRITFSKDSLQASSGNFSFGSRTRQIMVDAKKFELLSGRKSPKKKSPRKTPGKSPKKKSNTPKSSGKKNYSLSFNARAIEESLDVLASLSAPRPSTTKRALFQSPPRRESNSSISFLNSDNSNSSCSQLSNKSSRRALFMSPKRSSPSKMTISSLYPARRKMTPKRALFKSPDKQSPSKVGEFCDKKRKRIEDDEQHPSKFIKNVSTNARDSSKESKPDTSNKPSTSLGSSQDISQHRKKKLMWTVAEALRTQNIDLKHPQFKVYASVLARVIRHFLPNLFTNGPRPEGSTTESMLRIARQYVFAVTRGKTVDQIIREAQKHKSRIRRPTGYVGLDKVNDSNVSQDRNKENILQDRVNIIEDCSSNKPLSKSRRSENVERIRRVINFGDDNDVSNTSIR